MDPENFIRVDINVFHRGTIPTSLKKQLDPRACADPESFVRGGPTLTIFFLVDEGRDQDPSTTLSKPSSDRQ